MTVAASWRNRIVDTGTAEPAALLANPRNWRLHPKQQRAALAEALDSVGWVSPIIVNRRSGFVVDGHLRVAMALERQEASVPVQYVDLDEREEGLILASLDPIAAMAGKDSALLRELVGGLGLDEGALRDTLAKLAGENLPEYTEKITSPIYEPSGPPPPVADLYDTSRADALNAEIDTADLPVEVHEFLSAAAARHTVFRFDRIANYYAHAPAAVQRLIEASALVIIDADQAIERGYFALHASIREAWQEDNPDAA